MDGNGGRRGGGGDDRRARSTRFVRLEKPTYLADIEATRTSNTAHGIHSDSLIEAPAATKRKTELDRAQHLESQGSPGAGQARAKAGTFGKSLQLANKPNPTSTERGQIDRMRDKHATSSASSPFISATPHFTTHDGGQLHYLKSNLQAGDTSFVTVHESSRPITSNRTNSREKELLVPMGEQRSELQGMLRVKPSADKRSVHVSFIDMTDRSKPRLFTGRNAVTRFQALSGPAPGADSAASSSSSSAAAAATITTQHDRRARPSSSSSPASSSSSSAASRRPLSKPPSATARTMPKASSRPTSRPVGPPAPSRAPRPSAPAAQSGKRPTTTSRPKPGSGRK